LTYVGGFDTSDPYSYFDINTIDCSITNFGGCIQYAIVWSLVPNPIAVDHFKNEVLTLVYNRAPFSYVAQARELLLNTLGQDVYLATSTIAVTTPIGNFTLMSDSLLSAVPYSNTVKTLLGYLMWFMLANYIYYRITDMFRIRTVTVA